MIYKDKVRISSSGVSFWLRNVLLISQMVSDTSVVSCQEENHENLLETKTLVVSAMPDSAGLQRSAGPKLPVEPWGCAFSANSGWCASCPWWGFKTIFSSSSSPETSFSPSPLLSFPPRHVLGFGCFDPTFYKYKVVPNHNMSSFIFSPTSCIVPACLNFPREWTRSFM